MVRFVALWAPVVSFMALVYLLAPQNAPLGQVHVWDKAVHVTAYAVFGACCLRAFHGGIGPLRRRPALLAFALAAGYGLFDEWNQSRIPGRDASMADWVADILGVGLAFLLVSVWMRVRAPSASC